MALARVGLGSNIGDAAAQVERALVRLSEFGSVVARSSLYRSRAWGVREQADFVNAAALLETNFAPEPLLRALQQLERELGRTPNYRWGPREIDLDLLTYDDLVVDMPYLIVPHPRLLERAFALVPLAEIDPAFEAARDRLGPDALAEVERLDRPKDDGLSWHL